MVGNVESRQKSRPFKKLVVTGLQEARLLQGRDEPVELREILSDRVFYEKLTNLYRKRSRHVRNYLR